MSGCHSWLPGMGMGMVLLFWSLTAAAAEEACLMQRLIRVRPSDMGVTHVEMLGQVENSETQMLENVVLHAFIKMAKMISGRTHMYGIGWVEGSEAGVALEFMPEHLPFLRSLPVFEVWAIDSSGNDVEGPMAVNVTHGSVLDTRRMGFRMESEFDSSHQFFQLRPVGWTRRYGLHTSNYPVPGAIQPWYDFPHPSASEGWTPQYDLMQHAVQDINPMTFTDVIEMYNTKHRIKSRPNQRQLLAASDKLATIKADGADTQTSDAQAKPDANETTESTAEANKLADVKAESTKVAEAVPADSQNTESKSAELKSAESKSADSSKVVEAKSSEIEPAATAAPDPNATVVRRVPVVVDVTLRRQREEAELAKPPPPIYASFGPASRPGGPRPPAQRVPMVVVMTLAFSPGSSPTAYVHYAQQLIRHTEYHLGQLRMQRTLVYIHETLFFTPEFHDFVSRYMPAEFVPYVTFVVWNEFFMIRNPWYDQYVKYFHGVVALWGYGGALAALIDIDEYIAFASPSMPLHEALDRCEATHLDWIRLTNQMIICDICPKAYGIRFKKGGGDTDLRVWFEAINQTLVANNTGQAGSECKLWRDDPLKRYTNLWNDGWFLTKGRVPKKRLGTLDAFALFQSKHLIRPEAAVAFMHHRGELLPNKTEAWLDPTPPAYCPYIAHLVHLNGFRPHRWGARLEYFKPARRTNWFVVPPPPSPSPSPDAPSRGVSPENSPQIQNAPSESQVEKRTSLLR